MSNQDTLYSPSLSFPGFDNPTSPDSDIPSLTTYTDEDETIFISDEEIEGNGHPVINSEYLLETIDGGRVEFGKIQHTIYVFCPRHEMDPENVSYTPSAYASINIRGRRFVKCSVCGIVGVNDKGFDNDDGDEDDESDVNSEDSVSGDSNGITIIGNTGKGDEAEYNNDDDDDSGSETEYDNNDDDNGNNVTSNTDNGDKAKENDDDDSDSGNEAGSSDVDDESDADSEGSVSNENVEGVENTNDPDSEVDESKIKKYFVAFVKQADSVLGKRVRNDESKVKSKRPIFGYLRPIRNYEPINDSDDDAKEFSDQDVTHNDYARNFYRRP